MAADELGQSTRNGGQEPLVRRRAFLAGGTAAAALTVSSVAGLAPTAQAAPTGPTVPSTGADALKASFTSGTLFVGAGKAPISIAKSILPLDGFTSVHDDIYVRVLLLRNGSTQVALVVLDLTSISSEALAQMRTAITKVAGVVAEDIVITVTHTFSAPHVNPMGASAGTATFVAEIVSATTTAATNANKTLRQAKVGYGTGKADVNVNRNVETADGYWLGTNDHLPSDKHVGVARFDDVSGNPIAILMNYNAQSCVLQDSVTASGDLPISADLAGAAVAHVESQYDDGVVGFWLVGACGDQFPAYRAKRYTIDKDKHWAYDTDAHDAGQLLLTVQGERLGTEVVRVSETIDTGTGKGGTKVRLVVDSATVKTLTMGHPEAPSKSHDFTPTGTAKAPIWILQIGAGVLAGVSPELSTSTALAIKARSKFSHTFVMSMLEGGAKNMADKWNYDHVTYAAVDSGYARGAAEVTAARIEHLVNRLHG